MRFKLAELKAKRVLKKEGLSYTKVSKRAYEDYKQFVNDKKNEKTFVSLIKVNRNYQCSMMIRLFPHYIDKSYGNLNIRYCREKDTITSIRNHYGLQMPYKVDYTFKKRFDKALGRDI